MGRVKNKFITPVVILLKDYNELDNIITLLKDKKEVIVNVSLLSLKDAYRVIDFLSGFVMGLDGVRKKIEDKIKSIMAETVKDVLHERG